MSLVFLLAITSACKEPQDNSSKGNLKINFKAFFDSNPLVVFDYYSTPDAKNLRVDVFNFMLSKIELVKTDGTIVPVKDADFVDFNGNTDINKSNAGVNVNLSNIEPGTYQSIRFGIGVDPSFNSNEPGNFPSDPFLGDPGNYWASWNSYIFSRMEGRLDTTPNAAGGEVSYLYHTGVDGMYQYRVFNKNFNIESNSTTNLNFKIDVKDIFYKPGAEINIATNNVSHSGAVGTPAYNLAKQTIINLADALNIIP